MHGYGMSAFLPRAPSEEPPQVSERQTLVFFSDEASPQFCMNMWLLYKLKLCYVPIRDLHHRYWNDVCNGLKKAGMWWVVLSTTFLVNLPFGPWEGVRLV